MPIRQDDNQPNRRFGIVNIILIGVGALLLFSSLFPNQNMQIPRVPYSTGGKKLMTGNIELIRFKDDGATIKKTFKYDEMARVNSPKNPILEEGDIINVRRTLLGITTEVVDEISNPVLSGYGLFKLFN